MAAYDGSTMTVVEALVQVRFIPLQLWLMVFLFHCGWWYEAGYSHYQSPPEVVKFSRITGIWSGFRPPGWVSYSLQFGGQRHFVHMKVNKHLLARHMPVFTYTDQGALLEDQPFVPSDCFYHGYVEGDPESLVALNSCFDGFRGMLQVHDITYEIKPKDHSNTLEHLVYRMDPEETYPPMRCGLTDEEIERQLRSVDSVNATLMQSGYEDWYTHRLYVELALVVDQNRYLHSDSNVSKVYTDVCTIVNQISLFLQSLDLDMILVGLDVWTAGNIVSNKDIHGLIDDLCTWKENNLNTRLPHDVLHLFIKQNFSRILGTAYPEGLCRGDINCGVEAFMDDRLKEFAFTVSHELGHNMGMLHDGRYCSCGGGRCIMYPSKVNSTKFSNCSYAEFWNFVTRITCIREAPDRNRNFKHARCGNSLVEEREECDCGSLKSCEEDPCCQSDCTLTPGSGCAFGLCCHDCQIVARSLVCRKNESECDLPEWCNGTSFHCPEDVYMLDGTPCAGGSGYCYEKRCNDRDEQCRMIFGNGAKNANHRCYSEMNVRGDRFGNCGLGIPSLSCDSSDTLCGRLQCDNVTLIPTLRDHNTVHWTQFNGISCWGTDYHLGMTIPDIGDVKDGTECGAQLVCIQRKCVSKPAFTSSCSPKFCNMSGVCNNRHHCHCNVGWKPPNCVIPGNGGSVDSGPPPCFLMKEHVDNEIAKIMDVLLYILFPLSLILTLCVLILIFKNRKNERK